MASLQLAKVRNRFSRNRVEDVEGSVMEQLRGCGATLKAGSRIAVGVGSRGVANLSRIVRTTIDWIKTQGGEPVIVPAMGSHGGAAAKGQVELLASYGVTEAAMGCPIQSSMDVVSLPQGDLPNQIFMDRIAHETNGVIVINRIKPHTDFHGPYESGLAKMCVIGLGKEKQAFEMHRYGVYGLKELVPKTAAVVLGTGKIVLGLGIVENAYDETALVEAVPAQAILKREPELLEIARANMPKLPVDEVDLLIVDRLGKNVSGTGMDTNIIGRIRIAGEPDPPSPRIKLISVHDLTEESHGNATGMGLADVTTQKLFQKVDFKVTYKNIVTSGFYERGKLPLVASTDRQAYEYALRALGPTVVGKERIVRIKDTLHLGEMYVSPSVLNELKDSAETELAGEAIEMFDGEGQLVPF